MGGSLPKPPYGREAVATGAELVKHAQKLALVLQLACCPRQTLPQVGV
jgi:hypothetical protein